MIKIAKVLALFIGMIGISQTVFAYTNKGPNMAAFAPDTKMIVVDEQYTSTMNDPSGQYSNTFIYSKDYGKSWKYADYPANHGLYNYCGPGSKTRGDIFAVKYLESAETGNMFVSVGASGLICTSNTGSSWQMGNPSKETGYNDTIEPFYDVTNGNGIFVAVGGGGQVMFSSEPRDKWSYSLNPAVFNGYSLNSVVFGQGKFVVVGNDANSWFSTDGQTWTQGSGLAGHANLEKVIFVPEANKGVGQFVAVGGDATIWYSPDGEHWKIAVVTDESDTYFRDVTYGNGVYVAIGDDNTIARSTDEGVTWTANTNALDYEGEGGVVILDHPHAITFYNNDFIAVTADYGLLAQNGSVFYSKDNGVTWSKSGIVFGNNQTGYCEGNDDTGCVNYLAAVVNTDKGMIAVPNGSGDAIEDAPAYILWAPTTGSYWFAVCDLGLASNKGKGGCFQDPDVGSPK